jgi:hypothetical protein
LTSLIAEKLMGLRVGAKKRHQRRRRIRRLGNYRLVEISDTSVVIRYIADLIQPSGRSRATALAVSRITLQSYRLGLSFRSHTRASGGKFRASRTALTKLVMFVTSPLASALVK